MTIDIPEPCLVELDAVAALRGVELDDLLVRTFVAMLNDLLGGGLER